MVINFFSEEIDYTFANSVEIRNWIVKVIKNEKHSPGTINYIFCNDNYLLNLNLQYLEHNTLTDIITFDYSKEEVVSGDIFISIERVMENATKFNVSFEEELRRVVVHGILHLCGHGDKSEQQKNLMRKMEDKYLKIFLE